MLIRRFGLLIALAFLTLAVVPSTTESQTIPPGRPTAPPAGPAGETSPLPPGRAPAPASRLTPGRLSGLDGPRPATGILHARAEVTDSDPLGIARDRSTIEVWFDELNRRALYETISQRVGLKRVVLREERVITTADPESEHLFRVEYEEGVRSPLGMSNFPLVNYRVGIASGERRVSGATTQIDGRIAVRVQAEAARLDGSSATVWLDSQHQLPLRVDSVGLKQGVMLPNTRTYQYPMVEYLERADVFRVDAPPSWTRETETYSTAASLARYKDIAVYWVGPTYNNVSTLPAVRTTRRRGVGKAKGQPDYDSLTNVAVMYATPSDTPSGQTPELSVVSLVRSDFPAALAPTVRIPRTEKALVAGGLAGSLEQTGGGRATWSAYLDGTLVSVHGPASADWPRIVGDLRRIN